MFNLLNHVKTAAVAKPQSFVKLANGISETSGKPIMKRVCVSTRPLPTTESELASYLKSSETTAIKSIAETTVQTSDGQAGLIHAVTIPMLASAIVAVGIVPADAVVAPPAADVPTDRTEAIEEGIKASDAHKRNGRKTAAV